MYAQEEYMHCQRWWFGTSWRRALKLLANKLSDTIRLRATYLSAGHEGLGGGGVAALRLRPSSSPPIHNIASEHPFPI